MCNIVQTFDGYKRKKDYLIAVDSDGCMFDVMELKHKECFIPKVIKIWELQGISKYAREAAEFVNLYSKYRGINRFLAYIKMLDLLEQREEVKLRGFAVPKMEGLREWIASTKVLSTAVLKEALDKNADVDLQKAYDWSVLSNEEIKSTVHGIMPFPYAEESLKKAAEFADIVVVSSASADALEREWREGGVAKYCNFIAGQELGSKQECLSILRKAGYNKNNMLMIGDAPGDLQAAHGNELLFYPIIPNHEENSWKIFCDEILCLFQNGLYAGKNEKQNIAAFHGQLLEVPKWAI